ncbi:acetate kinase [Microlunatus panaciterrae]|uniref:Acetate kinase n=1 Tax=Microlunatus panaciterrae TaxID=400768 RepID=A0ABS2RK20_9ACTN|nr:acetate kinase [Microlunatus panaciterrae]MBM7799008.1 acetate kinase [Microlunatus panaciterrae]
MVERAGTVLVINSGSSSLKYQLTTPTTGAVLAWGLVERIGESSGRLTHHAGDEEFSVERTVENHDQALTDARQMFDEHGPQLEDAGIIAVGHRVVHGGATFAEPVVIDDRVIAKIEELVPLAPLHNPPALAGIAAARRLLPDVPHVAVFDTAFFAGLPAAAATYAIPPELAAKHHIRRYGFHGTSHRFVSESAARLLGRDPAAADLTQIVLHLGNGCSASAIRAGRAVETSMGLTPLQGLVMGTRSGDVDPGLHAYLYAKGMSMAEIDQLLNKESGLKGLAGVNDFRELQELCTAGDEAARLAFDIYVHRIKLYVGGYLAVLGSVEMLAFTAGVGQNSPEVRAAAIDGLDRLGITIDPELNQQRASGPRTISPAGASTSVLVIPTNEELAIARDAAAFAPRPEPDSAP